jgi:hypothetical protein
MIPYFLAGLKGLLSVGKKIFLVVAAFVIVISLFSYFLNKDKASLQSSQIDPIKKNRAEIYKVINDPKLKSSKQGKTIIALYRASMCAMIGEVCTNNPADGDNNFGKSAFGFISKLMVFPFTNPPASGIYWVYSGLQSAGFVPKTYAAEGIGFAAIKPFSNIWIIFRDISYMVLVVILIAIGFMIMFRMKMNPQTVISVENALPRIVIALILITFSFAIAGFLIDLMYIAIGIIVSVLSNGNNNFNATTFQNEYMMGSAQDLWLRDLPVRSSIFSIGYTLGNSFLGLVPAQISALLRSLLGIIALLLLNVPIFNMLVVPLSSFFGLENVSINAIVGGGPGTIIKNILLNPVALVVFSTVFLIAFYSLFPLVIYLLIIFSIFFTFFRILSLLFTSYLNILISIVLSPLLLLLESVPGTSTFKNWIIGLISNLLAFPITIAIFALAYIIVYNHPDLEFSARLPYLSGFDNGSFKILVGVGLIFIIPELVKTAREAIGFKPLPISIGPASYFGGVSTAVGGGTGVLGQFGSIWLGISAIGQFKNLLGGKATKAAEELTQISGGNRSETSGLKSTPGSSPR